jgi:hypothetical protein
MKPEDKYELGSHVQIKLDSGKIINARITAVIDYFEGLRLRVTDGKKTLLVTPGQIVSLDALP